MPILTRLHKSRRLQETATPAEHDQSNSRLLNRSPPVVQFTNLPNVPLINVFDHLSLHDQLRLGAVNTKLRSLRDHVFKAHKSLTILLGDDPLKYIWKAKHRLADSILDEQEIRRRLAFSQLHLRQPTKLVTINWLIKCFPSITELTIAIDCPWKCNNSVITLLRHFASSLITLSIVFYKFSHVGALITTVNTMSKLKHLTVYSQCPLSERPLAINLPILAQLESFNFYSSNEPNILVDSLRQYALPNSTLTARIGCSLEYHRNATSLQVDPLLSHYFTYFNNITTFCYIATPEPRQFFAHTTRQLTSLRTVSISLQSLFPSPNRYRTNEITYLQLLQVLSTLKHLFSLSISFNLKRLVDCEFSPDQLDQSRPCLSALQLLSCTFPLSCNVNLFKRLQPQHCFPNLNSLSVTLIDGADSRSDRLSLPKRQQIARQWFNSLHQLDVPQKRLQVSIYNPDHQLVSYDDLLAISN